MIALPIELNPEQKRSRLLGMSHCQVDIVPTDAHLRYNVISLCFQHPPTAASCSFDGSAPGETSGLAEIPFFANCV